MLYCIALTALIMLKYFEKEDDSDRFAYKISSFALYLSWMICFREVAFFLYKIGIFMLMIGIYFIIYYSLKSKDKKFREKGKKIDFDYKRYTFGALIEVMINEKYTLQAYKPIDDPENIEDSKSKCVICFAPF